jgi:transcriptional regulator with XRE-family HTH domain
MLTIRFNRNNIGLGGEAMDDYKITWRAARVNAGYTLKEVSEMTKKNMDLIRRYEKDSTDIPWALTNELLKLYKVPAEIIFFGRESDLIGNIKVYAIIS